MSDTTVKVVIPFRDRGIDPRRTANLNVVMAWWWAHGFEPFIADDGGSDDEQFNRHRAYNRAVSGNPADVYVFSEADMLIPPHQIVMAVRLAKRLPVLAIPFTQYRYLSDTTTATVRDLYDNSTTEILAQWMRDLTVFGAPVESTREGGGSIGAVNVVSRETLDLTGGYTEATSGNWYDDNIINEGWAFLTGNKSAYVPGPAVHLYHLPGWTGDHLTDADREATQRNKDLLSMMRHAIAIRDRAAVRSLMEVRA